MTQAEKFDLKGTYIAQLGAGTGGRTGPAAFRAVGETRMMSRIAPDYPRRPLVDLAQGREGALAAYRKTGD